MTLASSCTNCQAGAYSTGTGLTLASSCTNCQAGAYSTGTRLTLASVCTLCSAGTCSPTATCQSCWSCAANGFAFSNCGSGATVNTVQRWVLWQWCDLCSLQNVLCLCHTHLSLPTNSLTDTSTCACNVCYYCNCLTCTACKTCHTNTTLVTACPSNSASDT